MTFHKKRGKKIINCASSEASKNNKVLKFQKPRVRKQIKFLPTVLGKTLQILSGKGRWREVLLAVPAPRLPVRGPPRRSLFLRFSGCFASVFPSSLVSQPRVKVGKTRPTQRPLRSRCAEQGGKKKTGLRGEVRRRGASARTSSPTNHVILGGRVGNTEPVRR